MVLSCKKESPPQETGTVIDSDGNIYQTIKIGNQWWMAENLNTGIIISSSENSSDNDTIEKFCMNNDQSYCEAYGGLYSWDELMQYSVSEGAQGICPEGWHIPTDAEVKQLEVFLGMPQSKADIDNTWRGSDEGKQLKPEGSSGFNFLMGGAKQSTVSFFNYQAFGYFYTSTMSDNGPWRRCLQTGSSQIGRYDTYPKTYAMSVRCLKNE